MMNAARLLEQSGVEYNVLTVVTGYLAERIDSVFPALCKGGFHFQQYIPVWIRWERSGERGIIRCLPPDMRHFSKNCLICGMGNWSRGVTGRCGILTILCGCSWETVRLNALWWDAACRNIWWRRTAAFIPAIFTAWMNTGWAISARTAGRSLIGRERGQVLRKLPHRFLQPAAPAGGMGFAAMAAGERGCRRENNRVGIIIVRLMWDFLSMPGPACGIPWG